MTPRSVSGLMHLQSIQIYLVPAALLFGHALLAADQRPSESSVRELLNVSGARASSGALFEEMERVTEIALRGLEHEFAHHEGGDEVLAALARELNGIMREELAWERLRPLYIDVYRDVFDQDEVDALVGFFKSPAGRAYVAKQPQITARTSTLLEPRTGPIMDRVNRAITEAMDALGGRPHQGHHHHHGESAPGPREAHPPAGR